MPAKSRKTRKAAPNWIATSGQSARPEAIQKGIASSAIAALSSFEIVRDRMTLIVVAFIRRQRMHLNRSDHAPGSIACDVRKKEGREETECDRTGSGR